MHWTAIPAGELNAAEQRLRVAFGESADTIVSKINGDSDLASRVARFVLTGGYKPSTSQKRARKIMGKNFFGVEDAVKHFGVQMGLHIPSQPDYLREVPWSEEVLVSCRNTHILVAVFPVSVLGIYSRSRVREILDLFLNFDWHCMPFANYGGEIAWQLMLKTPVARSTYITWAEQQTLLSRDEEIPTTQVIVYAIASHFLVSGERLFKDVYVHGSDRGKSGSFVGVGNFSGNGLSINDQFACNSLSNLGLAAVRKQ